MPAGKGTYGKKVGRPKAKKKLKKKAKKMETGYMLVSLTKAFLLIKLDLSLVISLLKLLGNLLKVSQLKMSVKC